MPIPYYGNWEERNNPHSAFNKRLAEQREATWGKEEKREKPVYHEPYIPQRQFKQAAFSDVGSDFNQMRVHVHNMARMVMENPGVFSEQAVRSARNFVETSAPMKPRNTTVGRAELVSNEQVLSHVDANIDQQLQSLSTLDAFQREGWDGIQQAKKRFFEEKRATYQEFLAQVRRETVRKIKEAIRAGEEPPIKLRSLVDFWYPNQRKSFEIFLKKNGDTVRELLGIVRINQKAQVEGLLDFMQGRRKPAVDYEGRRILTPEPTAAEYLNAMHALEELHSHTRLMAPHQADEKVRNALNRFNTSYGELKREFIKIKY
jgi:hypothetical protein